MAEFDKTSGLPDIMKNLMQSPEILEIMKNLSGTVIAEDTTEKEKSQPVSSPLPEDIMEKLPLVMNMLRGEDPHKGQTPSQATGQPMPDMSSITAKLPQVLSALSESGIKSGGEGGVKLPGFIGDKNRKALLKALRPYMSDRKKSAIDTMLSMNSMAEIMALLMEGE